MRSSARLWAARKLASSLDAVSITTFCAFCCIGTARAPASDPKPAAQVLQDANATSVATSDGAVDEWIQSQSSKDRPSASLVRRPKNSDVGAATLKRSASDVGGVGRWFWWPTAGVLAMIGIAAWLARRWLPQARAASSGPIRVLTRCHLSSKQGLCLVRLGDELVLLGVTPDRIEMLVRIEDAHRAASIIAAVERGRGASFGAALGAHGAFDRGVPDRKDEAEPAVPMLPAGVAQARSAMGELLGRVRKLAGTLEVTAEPSSRPA